MPPLPTGQSHFSPAVLVNPAPTARYFCGHVSSATLATGLTHPTHSKEVFIPATGLFGLSLTLCPISLQGVRQTPHFEAKPVF